VLWAKRIANSPLHVILLCRTQKRPGSPHAMNLSANDAQAFLSAVENQQPVGGLTHNFYRYPARFSPHFARAAIESFSRPGEVVLDPFMGGATTLVEARALGRHAAGSDINSLSVFLAKVKTTLLSEDDLGLVEDWVWDLSEHLNLHKPPVRAVEWQLRGYQRHLPWPIRKTIEFALARLNELPHQRQRRFVRCLFLRAGQWALDCREQIPSAEEFRIQLLELLDDFIKGMRDYRQAIREYALPNRLKAKTIAIQSAAVDIPTSNVFTSLSKKPTLVVTSPPYPGVYVLYHRWKVLGRKESPAPFWVADCLDGQGQAHYCFGHRKQKGLKTYFEGIRASFTGVRRVIDPKALLIQMVAFSDPDWQIPCYLQAMVDAGFDEVLPQTLGIPVDERLWRTVPGRRWFALLQGNLSTSQELVLFHRPKV
jgi:DNA methylase